MNYSKIVPGFHQCYLVLEVRTVSKQRSREGSTHRGVHSGPLENGVEQLGPGGFCVCWQLRPKGRHTVTPVSFLTERPFRSSADTSSWHQTPAEVSERVAHSFFFYGRSVQQAVGRQCIRAACPHFGFCLRAVPSLEKIKLMPAQGDGLFYGGRCLERPWFLPSPQSPQHCLCLQSPSVTVASLQALLPPRRPPLTSDYFL